MVLPNSASLRDPVTKVAQENPLARQVVRHPAILTGHRLYFTARLHVRRLCHNRSHAAGIDPLKLYWVSPDRISKKMWGGEEFGKPMAGRVVGGEWDRDVQRFEDYELYRMMKAHFEDGVPWESTAHYRDLLKRVKSGETVWHHCSSKSDIDTRCAGLDDLYRRIDREGVLPPRVVESTESSDPLPDNLLNRFPVDLRAISINLGRDGDPVLDDGRHRLIVAKLCEVAEIPVTILVRHRRWQAKRDDWANGKRTFHHFDIPL